MIETTGNGVTNHLAYLNHYNKDDDSSNHHIPLEALVTVANTTTTKPKYSQKRKGTNESRERNLLIASPPFCIAKQKASDVAVIKVLTEVHRYVFFLKS